MAEIHKLRAQLASIVQANSPGVKGLSSPKLDPPSEVQLKAIRQLLAAAFVDQVAVRADLVSSSAEADAAGGRAHPAARRGAKFSSTRGVPYRAMGVAENAYVHPASALFHQRPPEWIVFAEVQRSESGQVWLKSESFEGS